MERRVFAAFPLTDMGTDKREMFVTPNNNTLPKPSTEAKHRDSPMQKVETCALTVLSCTQQAEANHSERKQVWRTRTQQQVFRLFHTEVEIWQKESLSTSWFHVISCWLHYWNLCSHFSSRALENTDCDKFYREKGEVFSIVKISDSSDLPCLLSGHLGTVAADWNWGQCIGSLSFWVCCAHFVVELTVSCIACFDCKVCHWWTIFLAFVKRSLLTWK